MKPEEGLDAGPCIKVSKLTRAALHQAADWIGVCCHEIVVAWEQREI